MSIVQHWYICKRFGFDMHRFHSPFQVLNAISTLRAWLHDVDAVVPPMPSAPSEIPPAASPLPQSASASQDQSPGLDPKTGPEEPSKPDHEPQPKAQAKTKTKANSKRKIKAQPSAINLGGFIAGVNELSASLLQDDM